MPILNWLGRDEALKTAQKTPYRLLEEVPELGYGDKNTENMIVQGDNLEALKALLPFYAGQVKCIYIDPPYNTGKAFDHYDDNLEHSTWLSFMQPRLETLKEFLRKDGFFCCQIDDAEGQYLRVLLDEVFGRDNYLTTFYIQVRYPNKTLAEDSDYQKVIEQCHIYAKSKIKAKVNRPISEYSLDKFKYEIVELSQGQTVTLGNKKVEIFKSNQYLIKEISPSIDGLKETWATGSLTRVRASAGEFFELHLASRKAEDGLGCLYKVYGIGEDGLGYRYISGPKKITANKGKFYSGIPLERKEELKNGKSYKMLPVTNFYDFAGSFGNCRLEGNADFKGGKKPERLLELLINYFTNPKDLVMDVFLGSGTTAAVAQKMGRCYIGIEKGEHAKTHCVPRLKAVVDGEQGGISKSVNWQGGGGFRFYKLGEQVFDAEGHINEGISFENLSAHVWFTETKMPFNKPTEKSTFLGFNDKVAYALLYNGILRDKQVDGGNVLTNKTLQVILDDMKHQPYDKLIIYGESSRISQPRLKSLNIEFKQTPYDIKAR